MGVFSAVMSTSKQEEELIAKWEAAQVVVSQNVEAVQKLKNDKASKEDILAAVETMKRSKEEFAALEKALFPPDKLDIDRDAFENLLTRRFFICPSFSIYGGAKGFYDFGPPGCAIKNNMLAFWRQFFVLEENMLEIDTSTVTPEVVLKTSGHVKKFNDLTIKDLIKASSTPTEKLEEYRTVLRSADDYTCEQLAVIMKKYNRTPSLCLWCNVSPRC